jgi:Leucine-rich repeat (LRR) protein
MKMHIKKLDDNIIYYTGVIPDPNGFVNQIESLDLSNDNTTQISKWKTWTASDHDVEYGLSKDGMFSNMQYYTDEDLDTSMMVYQIKLISDLCFANYSHITGAPRLKLPDYFSIRKYNSLADMGQHVDAEDPTDKAHPVVSGVLYLNDNYEGGEIYFPEQDIKIKPEAGSLVMFPSYRPYFHHPLPVTSGSKYMVPFFWFDIETNWG